MYHSLYMWKSCSEPTPYERHIGWRGVTSVQGGILADYDQIDTHVLKWNPAKFDYPKSLHIRATRDWDIPSKLRFNAIYPSVAILVSRQFRAAYWLITTKTLVSRHIVSASSKIGKLCTTHFICGNLVLSQRLTNAILADVVSRRSGRHISWLRPNWYTCPEMKSCQVWSSLVSSHLSYTWLRYSFLTPFWCYISVGGHPGVTSVQGGILTDYDQNFSRGWDSPDTKLQLPQSPGNYVPLTLYVEIFFIANALQTPYWLTWCHVDSGRHIGWLRPNWYTCPEVKACQVWLS